MIEPQLACAAQLTTLCERNPKLQFEQFLLGSEEGDVFFIDEGDCPSTGARRAPAGYATSTQVRAKTLDSLFAHL